MPYYRRPSHIYCSTCILLFLAIHVKDEWHKQWIVANLSIICMCKFFILTNNFVVLIFVDTASNGNFDDNFFLIYDMTQYSIVVYLMS